VSQDRRTALLAMLEADPNDAFARYALAMEHAGMGDVESAIRELMDLRQRTPEYIPAWHQLGVMYERTGDIEKARETYTEGISLAQRTGDTHAAGEMQESLDALS